ncbi:MAG: DNA-3-methyladenine glycosylase [Eubacteriales bacterium]|nr:DNA-3-methyladenine glycosylase [Eubacteriales bacterium]
MTYFRNNNAYIEKDGLFSIEKIFDCGQCFRFERDDNGFSGVAFGRKLRLYDEDDYTVFENVAEDEFNKIWKDYFDLSRDYNGINDMLCRDGTAAKAVEASRGIRILRQDRWETLCSFIISQNNNIPRIKKIIGRLCESLGTDIGGAYTFPSAEVIAKAGAEKLAVIKSGFRANYIADAALKVASGQIDLDAAGKMEYEEAKKYLMTIRGVGPKVADCVLLFGYSFLSAFPKDVWIKRVIDKYYGDSFDEKIFAPYGGIAQQYLFYYERWISSGKRQ